jgi:hypothetical protein
MGDFSISYMQIYILPVLKFFTEGRGAYETLCT